MRNFDTNRTGALMTILVLTILSISIVGTAQFVKGLDGDTLKNLLGGCIYGACKDTKITGNVTDGILAGCIYGACKDTTITGENSSGGGGGGGQPTPNTATLIVTKLCNRAGGPCAPGDFTITVTGNSPSASSFKGNAEGTTVILGPGKYTVSETGPATIGVVFSDNCVLDSVLSRSATGNINAGDIQKCTITNTT